MTHAGCVFCRLLAGGDADWVVRSGQVRAFFPLKEDRLAPGHTLVVPERHVVGILDADAETLSATMEMVAEVARAMVSGLQASGVNVLYASGPSSGQSVGHLHVHVIPRWPDDRATMWPTDKSWHRTSGDIRARLADQLG